MTRILIVGGGTAGWMAAAALGRILTPDYTVELIESDAIGTVGVGEATIPQILLFNGVLGIDEGEFLRATQGTIKLGIEFDGWGRADSRYMHAFGYVGRELGLIPFHHYWLHAKARGTAKHLGAYNLSQVAAYAGKFSPKDPIPQMPMGAPAYAYHFDAGLYAQMLRAFAEKLGVTRHEGRIVGVERDGQSGDVRAVRLDDDRALAADIFIDCTGFRGLLIEGADGDNPYLDWRSHLPCDRAIAVQCEGVTPITPYTRSTARTAGWQWRIPLQHRIGNGHVFCSDYMDEDTARDILLANLDGKPLTDPRTIHFTTGRRERLWDRNVVSLGLASGFLEPLESTSIHLIQSSIKHFIDLLPTATIAPADRDRFNRQMAFEFETIRDFIVLHYWANERDEPFWRDRRAASVPDTLLERVELFRAHGRLYRFNEELFTEHGWSQVLIGQGIAPTGYHPLAGAPGAANVDKYLASIEHCIAAKVAAMPTHDQFLSAYAAQREPV